MVTRSQMLWKGFWVREVSARCSFTFRKRNKVSWWQIWWVGVVRRHFCLILTQSCFCFLVRSCGTHLVDFLVRSRPCEVWWRWCQSRHQSPWKGCLIFTQRSSSTATETKAKRSLFWWLSWNWITTILLKWNRKQEVVGKNAVSWTIGWSDQQEYLTKINGNLSF
jgi:hypothetical protein